MSELFAGLIAGSMTKKTMNKAHPVFVDFIKSMNEIEARILASVSEHGAFAAVTLMRSAAGQPGATKMVKYFSPNLINTLQLASPVDPKLIQSRVENLARMGLLEVSTDATLTSPLYTEDYENISNLDYIKVTKESVENDGDKFSISNGYIFLSQLGEDFREVVISNKA